MCLCRLADDDDDILSDVSGLREGAVPEEQSDDSDAGEASTRAASTSKAASSTQVSTGKRRQTNWMLVDAAVAESLQRAVDCAGESSTAVVV